MTQLTTILGQPARQLAMTELLAEIDAENRALLFECEVEAQCRKLLKTKTKCGYIPAGTVSGCRWRRTLLDGGAK